MLRQLKAHATYCARTAAQGLALLQSVAPSSQDGRLERIQRGLLVRLGARVALAWQGCDE